MPTMPAKVTSTIHGVTGPMSSGETGTVGVAETGTVGVAETGAVGVAETGPGTGAGQRASLLIRAAT